jgi:beta-galactosidase
MRKTIFLSLALMAVFIAQAFRNGSTSSTKKQFGEQRSMINSVSVSTTDTVVVGAAIPPEIENPELLGINKEPAHATLMVYGSQAEALKAIRHASSFCQSLNGMWKFNWVAWPQQRPVDFYQPSFDVSGWKEIPVPSN